MPIKTPNCLFLDIRSIALCKRLIGILVIWDAMARFNAGWNFELLPLFVREQIPIYSMRSVLFGQSLTNTFLSPYFWCDQSWYHITLNVILLIAAIGAVFGYRQNVCVGVCWILIASLHTRNPFILYGGDHVLRITLFWLLFLPAESCRPKQGDACPSRSGLENDSSWVLVVQVLMIYVFTALHKSGVDWRGDSLAVKQALSIESLRTSLGGFIYQRFPDSIFRAATITALVWEEVVPLIAIFASCFSRVKVIAAILMMVFHASIALVFDLCFFQLTMIALWSAFLPRRFWDDLASRYPAMAKKHTQTSTGSNRWSFQKNLILVVLLCYCLAWNISTLPISFAHNFSKKWQTLGYFLRLDQHWGLFGPNVMTRDGWFVAVGITEFGEEIIIDAYGETETTFARPENIAGVYRSRFWREYLKFLFHGKYHKAIESYAAWLTSHWNKGNPDRFIKRVQLYFMLVDSRLPENGIVKVQTYPPKEVTLEGKSLFIEDVDLLSGD